MKKSNPYQTNKGGLIKAPKNVGAGDPKPTTIKSKTDLRVKKGK
jgi:hypothetical protein